jgi:chromosome segregation protein
VTLAPGEPVLEAGIEITARPPGRESLPISLLSGGQRTLTALAILFAVFRAQPSPFCILDEVDAALDDANINRFLLLLSHSLGGTQFVVVTHNKGTMAACDMLYGVTMAVRGVSHVVGVELAEVDDFVPAAKPQGARSEAGRENARKGTRSGAEGAEEEETIVELVPKQGVLGHVVRDPAPEPADETEERLRSRRSRGR